MDVRTICLGILTRDDATGYTCNARAAFVCAYGRNAYSAILAFLNNHRNEFTTDAAKVAAE